MSIYRDIGIYEVAKLVGAIAFVITLFSCLILSTTLFGYSKDAFWTSAVIGLIVGAIVFLAFTINAYSTTSESDSGEIKNKHAGKRKHHKPK